MKRKKSLFLPLVLEEDIAKQPLKTIWLSGRQHSETNGPAFNNCAHCLNCKAMKGLPQLVIAHFDDVSVNKVKLK
jgi:hypothetical protein